MTRLILLTRLDELSMLLGWVVQEYFLDTPTNHPLIEDKITERCSEILQAYFVRDHDDPQDGFGSSDTATLEAIRQQLSQLIEAHATDTYSVEKVDTVSFDGTTRFVVTLQDGDTHAEPLPEPDTG